MSRREWALLILLWMFGAGFNIAKPFHIDDAQFLDTAQWIAHHPLHPMLGPFNGAGFIGRTGDLDNPPLIPYLMAAWGGVFGYSEIAMHTLQSIFLFGDILFFYLLARILARPAAPLLTALFALSPAVVVGQNMMLDPALIAFWMGFFYCLMRAHGSDFAAKWIVRAGLFASAAVLTKYSSLVLVALALADGAITRRFRVWMAAAMPAAALGVWSLFNLYDSGTVHLLAHARPLRGSAELAVFAAAWALTTGALVPFALSLLCGYLPRWRALQIAAFLPPLALAALAAMVFFHPVWEARADRVLTVALFANAAFLLALLIAALRNRPAPARFLAQPQFLLLLWMLGATAFYLLFAVSVTTRHVLVSIVPLLLLLGSGIRVPIPRAAATAGLATTALLTIALAVSDWRFADFYRSSANAIGEQYRGRTVWFTAHWAWQYYARNAGLKQLDVFRPPLRTGDLIAMPIGIAPDRLSFSGRLREIDRFERETGPWTLFCTAAPARFYATTTPVTPWLLTNSCGGAIQVVEVESLGPD